MNNDNDYCLRFEDVRASLLDLRVWVGVEEIHPSLTEMRVLFKLLELPYRTVPTDELIRHADLTSREYLWIVTARLRKMFKRRYIVTHYGIGFSFSRMPENVWDRQIVHGGQHAASH